MNKVAFFDSRSIMNFDQITHEFLFHLFNLKNNCVKLLSVIVKQNSELSDEVVYI